MAFLKNKQQEVSEQVSEKELEITQLNETISDLQKELEDFKTQSEQESTYKAEFERVSEELKSKDEEIENLKALVDTQEKHSETVDKQVSNKVEEVVSNLGVESVEVEEENITPELSMADKFASMSANERLKFYQENREELMRQFKNGQ